MAEEKVQTQEEKDKQLQDDAKKQSEERRKFVDDLNEKIHAELEKGVDRHGGLQSMVKEVADKVLKTQVVAVGARYGPSPMELDELSKQEFPLIAPPMSDGTPVANIDQVPKKGEKPEEPQQFVPRSQPGQEKEKGHTTATAKK